MELTEEQSMAMDYIGQAQNKITQEGKADLWKKNTMENRPYFSIKNPDLAGLTAFVVAAGPSMDKNVEHLKNVSPRGMIVCVDAAFRFLMSRGITPEYCVILDGSTKMLAMMEGADTTKTTLVATTAACPEVVRRWQGPKYFVTTPFPKTKEQFNIAYMLRIVKAKKDIKAGDEMMPDQEYEVTFDGVLPHILTGGNVSTAAHHFALVHLKAQQVVFAGLDLSWKYETHHYAGHEHQDNVFDRTKTGAGIHKDWDGNEVFTNLALLSFKRWHETFAKSYPGSVINATEGGILGIGQEGERYPEIEFMTLEKAIAKYAPNKRG